MIVGAWLSPDHTEIAIEVEDEVQYYVLDTSMQCPMERETVPDDWTALIPEPVAVAGQYFRSRDGKTVHLAPCPRMGAAIRWTYADGKSLHAVVAEVAAWSHLRLCRACWPDDALAESGKDTRP